MFFLKAAWKPSFEFVANFNFTEIMKGHIVAGALVPKFEQPKALSPKLVVFRKTSAGHL